MRHTIESRHTASLARSRVCLSPQPSGVAAHEFDEPGRGEKRISWKAEVIADSSGKWVGDTVRFATRREAWSCLQDLTYQWAAVRYERVVETIDPVNHRWIEHGLLPDAQISMRGFATDAPRRRGKAEVAP